MLRGSVWKPRLIAGVLLIGCTKEPLKDNPKPSASASGSATVTTPQPPTEPPECVAYKSAYNAALALPSANACAKDEDCTCFNGGITKEHGCGGITNKTTAADIEAIAKDGKAHNCGSGILCGAWSCSPICKAGKCVNSTTGL